MTDEKLTKNERREQAREQARLARENEKKREKRNRLLLQGGIVATVLVILGIVGLVLSQTLKPAGPGPLNMISGGATFTTDLKVVETPRLQEGETREARETDWTKLPVDVTIYVDYMCPACGAFEQANGSMLEQFAGSGDINLTVYPINFLDTQSLGSKYSTRAANAFACVVDQQPDFGFAYHNLLLSQGVQPAEGTTGLTDEELVEQAVAAGASATSDLKRCINNQQFASFIEGNWKTVSEVGMNGLAEDAQLVLDPRTGELQPAGQPQLLASTPTVIVNGYQWVEGRDGTLEQYILKVKAEIESKTATTSEDAQ